MGSYKLSALGMVGILGVVFFLGSAPAKGYYIIDYGVYTSTYGGDGPNISVSENSLFITDIYNQYSEIAWQINGAEEAFGRIQTQFSVTNSVPWAAYIPIVNVSFQILPQDGNPTTETVLVDAWGALVLDINRVSHDPITWVCCTESASFWSPYDSLSVSIYDGSRVDAFSGTYELQTNTTYTLNYGAWFYVETGLNSTYFNSWDDYHTFIETYGYSGVTYNQVRGFFQHGMVVHSVPEPGTVALLSTGLIVMMLASRRARRKLIR